MPLSRQQFIARSLALCSLSPLAPLTSWAEKHNNKPVSEEDSLPQWNFPSLQQRLQQPVMLKKVDLLKTMDNYFLVVSDQQGNKGVAQCNARMPNLISLLKGLVIPYFLNKDARDIAQLVDNAYRLNSNYKYTGMPLWN